jgi:hypothetical protein
MRHVTRILLVLAGLVAAPATATAQWDTPNRAFHKDTSFPLEGRHMTVACASCHINGVTKGTPTTCYGCHWERRQDDRYRLRLGTQCETCHRPTAWTATRWDHGAVTGMPLNASHKTVACESCHRDAQFTSATTSCINCHRKDYDATTTPNHAAAGFSAACDGCHRPGDATFTQARFDHNASFQLVGTHAMQDCAACHVNGRYKGTPRDCYGCHRDDYQRTTRPSHASAGYPTACESCHRPNAPTWLGATSFNHAQTFPLVGQHAMQNCTACHVNNVYQGTPRDCVGCHRDDYQRTTAPNHASAGYSTACETCHSASASSWRGASINHNQFFPLVGRHSMAACASCHVNGRYKGTPRECAPCHQTQYDRTTSPNHVAAGFPNLCESCHRATDTAWTQGRFTHTWFPITSGKHAGNPCSACHNNPANYQVFTCLTCHNRTKTDDQHRGRSGYRYESTACYACHPNGRS